VRQRYRREEDVIRIVLSLDLEEARIVSVCISELIMTIRPEEVGVSARESMRSERG